MRRDDDQDTKPGPDLAQIRTWAGDDLAALPGLYDKARTLLERGRETWSERTVGDDEAETAYYAAMQDKAAKEWNAIRGWGTPGESRAPLVVHVLQAVGTAEILMAGVASQVRRHLQLGPLFTTQRPTYGAACAACRHATCRALRAQDLRPAAYLEAPERFARARQWMAESGLPAADGDLLLSVARDIGRIHTVLDKVVNPEPVTIKLRVPCPECQRMALRVWVDTADRTRSSVQCHSKACGAEWGWHRWPALGAQLGIDVWDAMEVAAA